MSCSNAVILFVVTLVAAIGTNANANPVRWIDGKDLPVEGKAFDDVESYYDRLPAGVTTNVNADVRSLKHHATGMQHRFVTDSKNLVFRWVPSSKKLADDNMTQIGESGIDIYRQATDGKWWYVKTGRIYSPTGGECAVTWRPGTPCLVNLPLYNGLESFLLGVDVGAEVKPLPPRQNGVTKPVVFYGTSITQGGSASRPGLAFVNIIGRDLDVPIVNLGFSGSGVMEYEMSEHLARIDASCYVLDCLWNMSLREADRPGRAVETNYEPFIRNLRAKRPGVPIVMAEKSDVTCGPACEMDVYIRKLYEKLVKEGWRDLVYLPKTEMYSGDREGTIDGTHPNDLGMVSLSRAYGMAVKKALGIGGGHAGVAMPEVKRRGAW